MKHKENPTRRTGLSIPDYFKTQTLHGQSKAAMRDLVDPVVKIITDSGLKNGYFASPADA